jgi:hypothetical protein
MSITVAFAQNKSRRFQNEPAYYAMAINCFKHQFINTFTTVLNVIPLITTILGCKVILLQQLLQYP